MIVRPPVMFLPHEIMSKPDGIQFNGSRGTQARLYYGQHPGKVLQRFGPHTIHILCTSPLAWKRQFSLSPAAHGKLVLDVLEAARPLLHPQGVMWVRLQDDQLSPNHMAALPWTMALTLRTRGWLLREAYTFASSDVGFLFGVSEEAQVDTRALQARRILRWDQPFIQSLLRASPNQHRIVLDPFAGQGAIGRETLANGRHFVGIDQRADLLEQAIQHIRGPGYAES